MNDNALVSRQVDPCNLIYKYDSIPAVSKYPSFTKFNIYRCSSAVLLIGDMLGCFLSWDGQVSEIMPRIKTLSCCSSPVGAAGNAFVSTVTRRVKCLGTWLCLFGCVMRNYIIAPYRCIDVGRP